MKSYINIGDQEKNLSGIGSRGYMICRKQKSVIIHYGAIELNGRLMYKRIIWAKGAPREEVRKFRTIEKAEEYKKKQIVTRFSHGYKIINQRIYKYG